MRVYKNVIDRGCNGRKQAAPEYYNLRPSDLVDRIPTGEKSPSFLESTRVSTWLPEEYFIRHENLMNEIHGESN